MDKPFHIVIVGGGTAGWLSAAFLNAQLPEALNRPVKITLVEASDIPTIGVGEATLPSLRETLAACGLNEREFMRETEATFKHGIEFINWVHAPTAGADERYFHPFGAPLLVGGKNMARQWSKLPLENRPAFADAFSVQPEFARAGLAPKHVKDRPYDGALSYAYHLDAGLFAQMLKQRCMAQGVHHIVAKVEGIALAAEGQIENITLDSGESISADFFIDCTGFSARLINQDKTNSFIDKSHQLFVDSAVTVRREHASPDDIRGYTKCTAQKSGWIWDIALQKRRGIGHVYSSKYISDDDALCDLAAYLGEDVESLEARKLSMRIGYFQDQWRSNCAAIGLASGFLEPLESTGIYLTEMANWALLELLPRFVHGVEPQGRYNEVMAHHYENIVDFLKLHYCLSQREDSQFWIDNRNPETIPQRLQSYLKAWQNSVPSIYDFDRVTQCFSANNYQFVLYGMQWRGHDEASPISSEISRTLSELSIRRERLKSFVARDTVSHHDFLNSL